MGLEERVCREAQHFPPQPGSDYVKVMTHNLRNLFNKEEKENMRRRKIMKKGEKKGRTLFFSMCLF